VLFFLAYVVLEFSSLRNKHTNLSLTHIHVHTHTHSSYTYTHNNTRNTYSTHTHTHTHTHTNRHIKDRRLWFSSSLWRSSPSVHRVCRYVVVHL